MLIGNTFYLAGCASEPSMTSSVYAVNIPFLAETLKARAKNESGRDVAPLVPPELPTLWVYGMSGVCDNFTETQEVYCRYRFHPPHDILTGVEESLQDSFSRRNGHDDNHNATESELLNTVLASWNETLASLDPSGFAADRGTVDYLFRISARCGIVGLTTDLLWPLIALMTKGRGPLLSLTCLVGAVVGFVTWDLAKRASDLGSIGPSLGKSYNYGVEGQVIVASFRLTLWAIVSIVWCVKGNGTACGLGSERRRSTTWYSGTTTTTSYPVRFNYPPTVRLGSTQSSPAVTSQSSASRKRQSVFGSQLSPAPPTPLPSVPEQWSEDNPGGPSQPSTELPAMRRVTLNSRDSDDESLPKEEIAYQGERYVYDWFEGCELPNWSSDNWTSGMRARLGFGTMSAEQESGHADFTYEDVSGELLHVLRRAGLDLPDADERATYHLEVKATLGPCDEVKMRVSEDQVTLMNRYNQPGTGHVYILVRVFNLSGTPFMRLFLDPRSHPDLVWGMLQNGYYKVRTRNTNSSNIVNLLEPPEKGVKAVEDV
ncbi:hypothetical protein VTJ49DRAFT_7189 [Mycothermus thermophilus]|uniref:Protein NO VEIN C-terminal domain-containing protein n=1 Tax=Humicola insolens TaxID=85995 RepID=A0ABR3VQ90_HUMIN